MPAEVRLSPKDRRTVLEQLSRDRLGELTTRFELDVADRRSADAHIDAIVRKRSVDFRAILEALRREELQAACEALGLDRGGREKAALIGRILGEGEQPAPHEAAHAAPSGDPAPASVQNEGALKSALRRFVLDLAGGLRGRDAATVFASRLLRCFGWPEAGPPGAALPASLAVVDSGRRGARDVALSWPDRRTRASKMRGVPEFISAGALIGDLWLEGDSGVEDPQSTATGATL